jgi:hypothetical protein
MADLNRQKSPAPAEPSENRPPETEEERERRLRKERRRKLRVSWKPDATLTEVRLFTHDPEEELGPGDRSVGDVKGEGSVLKLHRDLDELEDEDEGGAIREETLRDYRALSGMSLSSTRCSPSLTRLGIDLAAISADDHARNFIKRAGIQQPVSPEKEAQEHREATTLMVFYTSPADVPSSPKEAPPPDLDEMVPDETAFGELPDQVKVRQFPGRLVCWNVLILFLRLDKTVIARPVALRLRLLNPTRRTISLTSRVFSRPSKAHLSSNSSPSLHRSQRRSQYRSHLCLTLNGRSTCSDSRSHSHSHRSLSSLPPKLQLRRASIFRGLWQSSMPSSRCSSLKCRSLRLCHRLSPRSQPSHRISRLLYPNLPIRTNRAVQIRPSSSTKTLGASA